MENKILSEIEVEETIKKVLLEYYLPALYEMYKEGMISKKSVSSVEIEEFVEEKWKIKQ